MGNLVKRWQAALPLITAAGFVLAALSIATPASAGCPPGGCITYNGGALLGDLDVYVVYWNSNVYYQTQQIAPAFYGALLDSTILDSLAEYDEQGGNGQWFLMDRGSLDSVITLIPKNTSNNLTDAEIQTELIYQIGLGTLPIFNRGNGGYGDVNPRPVFAVHFPPGFTITGPGSSGTSCASPGFCAYHGQFTYNTQQAPNGASMLVVYTVVPDYSGASACSSNNNCGPGAFPGPFTTAASHEIMEAVTDPDDVVTGICDYSNAGWVANNFCGTDPVEICDACNAQGFPLVSSLTGPGLGQTFEISKHWSNNASACVTFGQQFWPFPGDGCATSIGVSFFSGSGGQATGNPSGIGPVPWIIGNPGLGCDGPGSFPSNVAQWDGELFVPPGGAPPTTATYIAVSPSGIAWVLHADGTIWNNYDSGGNGFVNTYGGHKYGGCAQSIGIGNTTLPWIIGCAGAGSGGNGIYNLSSAGKWVEVGGSAIAITVSPDPPSSPYFNQPWIVNDAGNIYYREYNAGTNSYSWLQYGGCANPTTHVPNNTSPIAVGPNQDLWVLGCAYTQNGADSPVYHVTPTGWQEVTGAGVSLAVSPLGQPWLVNNAGNIFQ